MYASELIRRLKEAHWRQVTVNVPTSSAILVPHAKDRIALVLMAAPSQPYTVSGANPAVAGAGLKVPTTGAPVSINLWTDGPFVHGPLWAISDVAAQDVTYWEAVSNQL